MTATAKKYESLQILRAIAAWMVVGHHYQQMHFNYQYDNFLSEFFVRRGSFGIDLFFVLSGFVMFLTASKEGTTGGRFFLRRALRIAPAYWFFSSVLLIWVVVFPKVYAYTDYTGISLLKSYLLIPGENPSGIGLLPFLTPGWTLIYEMAFYSTLAACLLLTHKFALQLCFLTILVVRFTLPDGLTYSPIFANSLILQFLFGIAIGWYLHSPLFAKINCLLPAKLQIAMLLIIGATLLSEVLIKYSLEARTVAASCFVFALILVDQNTNYKSRLSRFFVRCGDYSYSVYLSHILVIGVFVSPTGPWAPWYYHLGIIIAIIIGTHVVSALSYRWVENGPVIRMLRSQIKRTAPV